MLKRLVFVLSLLMLAACGSTQLQIQARIANNSAIAANDLLPAIVRAYTEEGLAVIQHASTRDEAQAGLAAVREHWRRVWGTEADGTPCRGAGLANGAPCEHGAWQALAATEDAWGFALEQQMAGQSMLNLPTVMHFVGDLHTDYCTLRAVVPSSVHLPDPPAFLSCESSSAPSGAPSSAPASSGAVQ